MRSNRGQRQSALSSKSAIQVAIYDYQQDPGASQLLSPLANVQREQVVLGTIFWSVSATRKTSIESSCSWTNPLRS